MRVLVIALLFLLVAAPAVSAGGLSVEAVAYPNGKVGLRGAPSVVVVVIEGPTTGTFEVTLLKNGEVFGTVIRDAAQSGRITVHFELVVEKGDELTVRVRHMAPGREDVVEVPVNMEKVEEVLPSAREIPLFFIIVLAVSLIANIDLFKTSYLKHVASPKRGVWYDVVVFLLFLSLTIIIASPWFGFAPLSGKVACILYVVSAVIVALIFTTLKRVGKPIKLSFAIPVLVQGVLAFASLSLAQIYAGSAISALTMFPLCIIPFIFSGDP